jgi:hypothetical protein
VSVQAEILKLDSKLDLFVLLYCVIVVLNVEQSVLTLCWTLNKVC